MNMVRVLNGEVIQTSLPRNGKLSNGQSVINYYLLSEATLKNEGWLPLEDYPPLYDIATEQIFEAGYDVQETKVIKLYRIEDYEAPKTTQDQLDELQQVVDILLGGEQSWIE